MMASVAASSGTCGIRRIGSVSGNAPMSPTVRTSQPKAIDSAVSTTMATRGEGTARVTRGSR